MAREPEAIRAELDERVLPDARDRLLALRLARGMVWRDGEVPVDGPNFPDSLTAICSIFGYGVLALALDLRDANRRGAAGQLFATKDAFTVAAEAIEAAIRRGDPNDADQGRHLVVCAAAMHLAGFAARSYSLPPPESLGRNLASTERALGLLLRRDLVLLREHISQWLGDPATTDDAIDSRLLDANDPFRPGRCDFCRARVDVLPRVGAGRDLNY